MSEYDELIKAEENSVITDLREKLFEREKQLKVALTRLAKADERAKASEPNPFRCHILERPFHDGFWCSLGIAVSILCVLTVPWLAAFLLLLSVTAAS